MIGRLKNCISNLFKKISKMDCLRIVLCLFLIFGILLPIVYMIFQINIKDLSKLFRDKSFYKMMYNSIVSSLISTIISIFIALVCSYMLNRSSVKRKNVLVMFLTIPMLIPSISHAMGLINLFGKNGFLDKLFGIGVEVYGLSGIILGSILYSFPVAFLLFYDALRYENKSIYDAAATLGISRFRTFIGITLPYLRKIIISAFFALFTMIFTDYGVPLAIGGKYKTLSVFLYQEVINRMDFSKGAIIGIVLLIPAIVAFVYDLLTKDDEVLDVRKSLIKRGSTFNVITIILTSIISFLLTIPQLSFLVTGFVKSFPNDMSFSLYHFQYAVTRNLWGYFFDSLSISLLSAIIGTIFAYMTAYLSTRIGGKVGKSLHFISIVTMAVPGMVLGLGYIFLFKGSLIYGTIFILVLVNVIHFFASPYIMAVNSFNKLNKNFEIVGSTLGISRKNILFNVLIPNTKNTLFEMFSYFFINSMITISAVAFLYSVNHYPLSLLIPLFESQLSYEEAGIVSLLILFSNIIFKIIVNIFKNSISSKSKKDKKMSKNEFDVLSNIGEKSIIDIDKYINENQMVVQRLLKKALLSKNGNEICITQNGLLMLEPYKVSKAIIIAAGFGSRLAPITIECPKPLIDVNGIRIIDTLLDALNKKDIFDITIVVGYKKEMFSSLQEKYPFIRFVENEYYNETNNISSLYVVKDIINNCYICEADLIVNNPNIIKKYQYKTNYYACFENQTDDWCIYKKGNIISKTSIGGSNCYRVMGISYWDKADSQTLRNDIDEVFHLRGGKENFWDVIPLKIKRKKYKIRITECDKNDITEIDTLSELKEVDKKYEDVFLK